ncbi:MAG TPA: histidine phosphatase family protein [Eoetvoesiella sp.]
MDLILWRHAKAEEGPDDLARALTRTGKTDAANMARWLKPLLPNNTSILVSPARRAQQTVNALELPYSICNELAPDKSVEGILTAASWPDNPHAVLVVGHNPTLSALATLLLASSNTPPSLQTAAICWIQSVPKGDGTTSIRLKTMMSPRTLG